MRLFVPIALLSVGALAKSCTSHEAYELNDCLDAAYEKSGKCDEKDAKCICDTAQGVVKCFNICPEGDFYNEVVKYASSVCEMPSSTMTPGPEEATS